MDGDQHASRPPDAASHCQALAQRESAGSWRQTQRDSGAITGERDAALQRLAAGKWPMPGLRSMPVPCNFGVRFQWDGSLAT